MATTRHNLSADWLLIGNGGFDLQLSGSVVSDCCLYFGAVAPDQNTLDYIKLSGGIYSYRGTDDVYVRAAGAEAVIVATPVAVASSSGSSTGDAVIYDSAAAVVSSDVIIDNSLGATDLVINATFADASATQATVVMYDIANNVIDSLGYNLQSGTTKIDIAGAYSVKITATAWQAGDTIAWQLTKPSALSFYGDKTVAALISKQLVMSFIDVTLAPAQTLAEWKTYLGIDSLTSVDIVGNTVTVYGVGSHTLPASLFSSDTNIVSFLDNDGLLLSSGTNLLNGSSVKNAIFGGDLELGAFNHDSISQLEYFYSSSKKAVSNVFSSEGSATANLKLFEAKELEICGDNFLGAMGDLVNKPLIDLSRLVQAGSGFLIGTYGWSYLDISSLQVVGTGLFSSIAGQTMTVKVHPAMLSNAQFIAFCAANTVTVICDHQSLTDSAMDDLTTLYATSSVLSTNGATNVELWMSISEGTTPATVILQGSQDGAMWATLGVPLVGVIGEAVCLQVPNTSPAYVRAKVTVAGTGIVVGGGMVTLRAW